jgi:hypothetical protein
MSVIGSEMVPNTIYGAKLRVDNFADIVMFMIYRAKIKSSRDCGAKLAKHPLGSPSCKKILQVFT